MSRWAGRSGTYLISWSQTEIDGHSEASQDALSVGAYWRWSGASVNLENATEIPPRHSFETAESFRRHSAMAARAVVGQAIGLGPADAAAQEKAGDRTFTLSDGRSDWVATLIEVPDLARPLLMFAGAIAPAGTPLRISRVETRRVVPAAIGGEGVVCFTPGTRIETPVGPVPVEEIVAGDKVATLDSGAQEVLWIGTRHLSLRDLRRAPDLAPIRIRESAMASRRPDGDLLVSPDHRLLVRGPKGRGTEVLVAARDLVDDWGVLRAEPAASVTYVHLMLERHHIVVANGIETESFHPGSASLDAIAADERLRLFDVMPTLESEPDSYGPSVRPMLSRAEAALLSAA